MNNNIIIKEKEIKNKDEKQKLIKENESINNHNLDNNFIIQCKLDYHKEWIYCSTVLKDGRFVTGSLDKSIIIYNNKTFKPDLIIKEHSRPLSCIIQLSSGVLASCSGDKTIKLYNINGNDYKVIQTLAYHSDSVNTIIELKNKKLVSCSNDNSIIFYIKDNDKYIKEYSISTNGRSTPIIQIKDNEICYLEENSLCFYDLVERKNTTKINNIRVSNIYNCLVMMTRDLLLATGKNKLSIINVNSHNLIRTINIFDSGQIWCACMLNENTLLTGDENKRIIYWKIEDDNLILISKKENAHREWITTLTKIGNGLILSGSFDNFVKIWQIRIN